jgi:hypothetical protein
MTVSLLPYSAVDERELVWCVTNDWTVLGVQFLLPDMDFAAEQSSMFD